MADTETTQVAPPVKEQRQIAPLLGSDVDAAPAAKPVTAPVAKSDAKEPAVVDEAITADAAAKDPVVDAADPAKAETDAEVAATWPENWRDLLAGGDDDIAKTIARYGSPKGVAKALREAQTLIRSGKLKRDMPDPTDEKGMAEWRKEQGIPEKAEDYKIPDVSGMEWSPQDKAIAATFFEAAHAKGLPQSAVDAALEWYAGFQQEQMTRIYEADTQAKDAAEEALKQEYGPEYRGNMKMAAAFLDTLPIPRAELADARLPNGRRLGDIPEFAQWAVDMGREKFGDTVFATPDAENRHNSRLTEIESLMKTDYKEYMRQGLDKEHLALLEQEQKRVNIRR